MPSFWEATFAACISETITMPLDTWKVRNQMKFNAGTKRPLTKPPLTKPPLTKPPLTKPFHGLSAGLIRQVCYGGTRLSLYPILVNDLPGDGFLTRLGAGLTAGCLGILVALPAEAIKVRVQSGTAETVITAFQQIYMNGGLKRFWTGSSAVIGRNTLVQQRWSPSTVFENII